jgi:chromosomal replication initiator protein
MYILKEKKGLGIMKIAELFERDHSSVVYAIARITKQLESDFEMSKKIDRLVN